MAHVQDFRLTRQAAFLSLIAAAYPVVSWGAVAGRVDFVFGTVVSVGADGRSRPLARGADVNSGEMLQTGANGRAQVRFTDGAYLSLQPNTQFKVEDYHYSGKNDGSEKGFFKLVKGGLRTITGAIGKTNRDAYQVATPAATIGIRGTGYNANMDQGLNVSVTQGAVALKNEAGELVLGVGQSGYVKDNNTAPQLTFDKPGGSGGTTGSGGQGGQQKKGGGATGGGDEGGTGDGYKAGDEVKTDGEPAVVPDVPQNQVISGLNTIAALSMTSGQRATYCSEMCSALEGASGMTITYDASGNRLYVEDGDLLHMDFSKATLDTGTYGGLPAAGFSEAMAWGRWYGEMKYVYSSFTGSATLSPNQGFHGIAGVASPSSVYGALPVMTELHFALIGATRPTEATGSIAPGTVTGGNLMLKIVDGSTYYVAGGLNINMNGGSSSMSFSGTQSNSAWPYFHTPALAASHSGALCASPPCSADIEGFFSGSNAGQAGMGYILYRPSGKSVSGAAVFAR